KLLLRKLASRSSLCGVTRSGQGWQAWSLFQEHLKDQWEGFMSVKLAGELQSGNVIMVDNVPVVVLKAQYNKSGRNAAVVKLRMKNLMTDRISEVIYKADEKLEGVMLEKKECTYSYYAAPNHVFVDSDFNPYEIDE